MDNQIEMHNVDAVNKMKSMEVAQKILVYEKRNEN